MMRKFVIDTSLFVNPYAREAFGKTPDKAVAAFIKKIKRKKAEFYMPPSVLRELRNFITEKRADELELHIKKRAPDLYVPLPAAILYAFVEDVRRRMNKGLRLAEKFAADNHPNNDAKVGKLREKYRDAVRAGIVDSKEDFELILLAKELDAALVSEDEGIIEYANKVGCEWIHASKMAKVLATLK